MVGSELSAIFCGLASAASWGAGDFSGGFATKRSNVYSVVIVSQSVGVIGLTVVALLLSEPFPMLDDMLYGGIAGISGVIGLVALYRGLALGRMGIVAPVAAVVAAAVPVIFSMFIEGLPAMPQRVGFVTALVAVWFISRTDGEAKIRGRDLGLPVVAGLGFGLFFIFIDRVNDGAVLWPLVAARIASISMLFVVIAFLRQRGTPAIKQLPVITLAGIFDTGGSAFFALATQISRLDIAAVLASLYPAATILLARFILQERLIPQQWGGIMAALIAVVLISS
jgi:drug/metabolite transporter (DMT)-like permease